MYVDQLNPTEDLEWIDCYQTFLEHYWDIWDIGTLEYFGIGIPDFIRKIDVGYFTLLFSSFYLVLNNPEAAL